MCIRCQQKPKSCYSKPHSFASSGDTAQFNQYYLSTLFCLSCLENQVIKNGSPGLPKTPTSPQQPLQSAPPESRAEKPAEKSEEEKAAAAKKKKVTKYMVIQMGQTQDELQDQQLIQFLSQNALSIKQHPGAVQFQVSKQMLSNLKKKFSGMKAFFPKTYQPADGAKEEKPKPSSVASPLNRLSGQRSPLQVSNSQQQKNEKSLVDVSNLQKAGSAFPDSKEQFMKKIDSKKTGAKYLSSTFDTCSEMQHSRGTVQKKNFFKTPTIQTEGSDYKSVGVNGLPTSKNSAATAGVGSPNTREELKGRVQSNLIKSSVSPHPFRKQELQKPSSQL